MKKLFLFTLVALCLCGCSNNSGMPDNSVVIKEVITPSEHLIKYTDGNGVYLYNINTESKALLQEQNGAILESLKLAELKDFKPKEVDTDNPVDMDIGVSEDIPCTYNSSIESSTKFVRTLEKNGWILVSYYSCSEYIDIYLSKSSRSARVVILKDKLKVFYDIIGKFEDGYTYINR